MAALPVLTVGVLIPSGDSLALQATKDSKADSRIKFASYRSDEVYPLLCQEGVVTTISFEDGEEVTSYGSGYSTAWEAATSGNQFFLKPKALDGDTNFIIVTNRRVYSFEVRYAKRSEAPTFRMIFRYPDTAAKLAKEKREQERLTNELEGESINTGAVSPRQWYDDTTAISDEEMNRLRSNGIFEAVYPGDSASQGKSGKKVKNGKGFVKAVPQSPYNWKYSMNFGDNPGSKDIAPEAVYDDGRFTVIRFPAYAEIPNVYQVLPSDDSDGEETMLKTRMDPDTHSLIVEKTAREFRLRNGQAVVGIYNEGFGEKTLETKSGTTVKGLKRTWTKAADRL